MVNPEIPHFWRTVVFGLATVVFSTTIARVQLARTARETSMLTRNYMDSGRERMNKTMPMVMTSIPTMSLLCGLRLKKM